MSFLPVYHAYHAYYRRRMIIVKANSEFAAMKEACKRFDTKKEYDITIVREMFTRTSRIF